VRSRDIKKRLEQAYQLEAQLGHDEAVRVEAQLRALARVRRRQAVQQRAALVDPDTAPKPGPEGLKRGPKPNLFLEKCEHGLHTSLTKRERKAFQSLREAQAPHVTDSTFLRALICEALEKHRRKDLPTLPFIVDLEAVNDPRRRTARPRAAGRVAA